MVTSDFKEDIMFINSNSVKLGLLEFGSGSDQAHPAGDLVVEWKEPWALDFPGLRIWLHCGCSVNIFVRWRNQVSRERKVTMSHHSTTLAKLGLSSREASQEILLHNSEPGLKPLHHTHPIDVLISTSLRESHPAMHMERVKKSFESQAPHL